MGFIEKLEFEFMKVFGGRIKARHHVIMALALTVSTCGHELLDLNDMLQKRESGIQQEEVLQEEYSLLEQGWAHVELGDELLKNKDHEGAVMEYNTALRLYENVLVNYNFAESSEVFTSGKLEGLSYNEYSDLLTLEINSLKEVISNLNKLIAYKAKNQK
jgi:hypothetical protein